MSKPIRAIVVSVVTEIANETTRTKWHLNLVCNAFNAHEREGNNRNNGYHSPSQLLHESEGKSEEVQGYALLQVDAV